MKLLILSSQVPRSRWEGVQPENHALTKILLQSLSWSSFTPFSRCQDISGINGRNLGPLRKLKTNHLYLTIAFMCSRT